jgi:hypothetical protein
MFMIWVGNSLIKLVIRAENGTGKYGPSGAVSIFQPAAFIFSKKGEQDRKLD